MRRTRARAESTRSGRAARHLPRAGDPRSPARLSHESHIPRASPAYALRSVGDLTDHSGVGCPPTRILACRVPGMPGPGIGQRLGGSGPGRARPARRTGCPGRRRAPRPRRPDRPGHRRAAPGPRRPPRSPAPRPVVPGPATPVTVQPGGSGHGHHSGVAGGPAASRRSLHHARHDLRRRCARARAAAAPGRSRTQRESVCIRSGARTGPPHLGQLTATLTSRHRPTSSRAGRQAGRPIRSARAWSVRRRPGVRTDPGVHGDAAGHPGVDRPGRAVLGDRADLVAGGAGRRRRGPGPSWPNSSTQRRGSVAVSSGTRAGQVVDADHRQAVARRPGDERPRSSRGGGRAGSGRSPWRRAGSTGGVRRCAPRRRGRRWRCGPRCRC